jgi:hypothetical protein
MQRSKEVISEEEDEFGVVCNGRTYKRKNTGAKKVESHSERKWRGPCTIVQIMEISHIKGEE